MNLTSKARNTSDGKWAFLILLSALFNFLCGEFELRSIICHLLLRWAAQGSCEWERKAIDSTLHQLKHCGGLWQGHAAAHKNNAVSITTDRKPIFRFLHQVKWKFSAYEKRVKKDWEKSGINNTPLGAVCVCACVSVRCVGVHAPFEYENPAIYRMSCAIRPNIAYYNLPHLHRMHIWFQKQLSYSVRFITNTTHEEWKRIIKLLRSRTNTRH